MTTPPLLHFYEAILTKTENLGPPPLSFEIVIADPASMGSKGGIIVDQKRAPSHLGKLKFAQLSQRTWDIKTSNIARFHFDSMLGRPTPESLYIDGHNTVLPAGAQLIDISFSRSSDGLWKVTNNSTNQSNPQLIDVDLARYLMAVHLAAAWYSAWALGCDASHKGLLLNTN